MYNMQTQFTERHLEAREAMNKLVVDSSHISLGVLAVLKFLITIDSESHVYIIMHIHLCVLVGVIVGVLCALCVCVCIYIYNMYNIYVFVC